MRRSPCSLAENAGGRFASQEYQVPMRHIWRENYERNKSASLNGPEHLAR